MTSRVEFKSREHVPTLTSELANKVWSVFSQLPDSMLLCNVRAAFIAGYIKEGKPGPEIEKVPFYRELSQLGQGLTVPERRMISLALGFVEQVYTPKSRLKYFPTVEFIRTSNLETLITYRGIADRTGTFLKQIFAKSEK